MNRAKDGCTALRADINFILHNLGRIMLIIRWILCIGGYVVEGGAIK